MTVSAALVEWRTSASEIVRRMDSRPSSVNRIERGPKCKCMTPHPHTSMVRIGLWATTALAPWDMGWVPSLMRHILTILKIKVNN